MPVTRTLTSRPRHNYEWNTTLAHPFLLLSEQVFELRQPMWARYLKLRFLTHHGTQHYWSLSLLRAYGQTHIDKFHSDNARLQLIKAERQRDVAGSACLLGRRRAHEYAEQNRCRPHSRLGPV